MTQTQRLRPALLALLTGLAALTAAAFAAPAKSAPITPQIFDANKKFCVAPIARQERLHGIPSQLLAAVSLAESGRWDKENAASFAWPWTVTAEGKGQFFASKAEAIAQVKSLRARGVRNIDVGCMQINLLHHPDAFPDLETAFDPESNVAYAARFLRGLFDDAKSWIAAAGNYHSSTPEFHFRYRAKITALWNDTRRRSAEEKRLETQAAYQQRRAAQLAARLDAKPIDATPRASLDMSARAPMSSSMGSSSMGPSAMRPASAVPPMPAAARGPAMASATPIAGGRPVPVGQILPRSSAIPLLRR